jgi:hypothetical protein
VSLQEKREKSRIELLKKLMESILENTYCYCDAYRYDSKDEHTKDLYDHDQNRIQDTVASHSTDLHGAVVLGVMDAIDCAAVQHDKAEGLCDRLETKRALATKISSSIPLLLAEQRGGLCIKCMRTGEEHYEHD